MAVQIWQPWSSMIVQAPSLTRSHGWLHHFRRFCFYFLIGHDGACTITLDHECQISSFALCHFSAVIMLWSYGPSKGMLTIKSEVVVLRKAALPVYLVGSPSPFLYIYIPYACSVSRSDSSPRANAHEACKQQFQSVAHQACPVGQPWGPSSMWC